MKMIKKISLLAAMVAASSSASAYTNLKDGKFDVHLWSKPYIECLAKPVFNFGNADKGKVLTSNFKLKGNPTQTYIIKMNGGMYGTGTQRRMRLQGTNNNNFFLAYNIDRPGNAGPWGSATTNTGYGQRHSFTMPANGQVNVPVKVTLVGDPKLVPAGHYADWVSFWIGY